MTTSLILITIDITEMKNMDEKMRKMCTCSAILAFVFCLSAGFWILSKTGFNHDGDAMATGIGLYFIGKAFFVGPMLFLAARKPKN